MLSWMQATITAQAHAHGVAKVPRTIVLIADSIMHKKTFLFC